MLLLKSIKRYQDRSVVPVAGPTRSLSLRTRVCHPNTRIHVRLLGPCFKTGRLRPFRQLPLPGGCSRTPNRSVRPFPLRAIKRRPCGRRHLPAAAVRPREPALTRPARCAHAPTEARCPVPRNTGLNRFPFNNFTHYLTPFSRCFSSFPHGTCSLSVSCQYLALDEIYHPI
jgi:hypothetical protein